MAIGEYLDKDIDELRVWSDNPRYGYKNEGLMDERFAINTLISVVGENKMLSLAKDIVETGGLLMNTLPTVVQDGGLLLVYDGNRRISILKMLFNPEIVENQVFKAKIQTLIKNRDISRLRVVKVLLTDRENAVRIMDGTHSGERGGAGMIPWGAYERDVSLVARGEVAQYPAAFSVAKLLGWKKKTDFSSICYTDLDRLFSSQRLKGKFQIRNFDESEKEAVNSAISALLNYKITKGFKSYSREFNITKDSGESDAPIGKFLMWYDQTVAAESSLTISLDEIEFFEGEDVPNVKEHIHIRDRETGELLSNVDDSQITISFVDPAGRAAKSLDPHLPGNWRYTVMCSGVMKDGMIRVKTLGNPSVEFGGLEVQYGASVNLRDLVKSAISSKSVSMKDSLRIKFVGDGANNPKLVDDIFTGDNNPGSYNFSFSFDNCGQPYSVVKTITVSTPQPLASTCFANSNNLPFVDALQAGNAILIPGHTGRLIKEINEAWGAGYTTLAACGMRTVLELTLLDLSRCQSTPFNNVNNLPVRVEEFKNFLLDSTGSVLNKMLSARNLPGVGFRNEKNFLQSLNCERMVSCFNLCSHTSAATANLAVVHETCQKDLSHFVQLAYLYLAYACVGAVSAS